jgi:Ca2+-binding EF-hand superfamily protein
MESRLIQRSELLVFLRQNNLFSTQANFDEMFAALDEDGDDYLDFEVQPLSENLTETELIRILIIDVDR